MRVLYGFIGFLLSSVVFAGLAFGCASLYSGADSDVAFLMLITASPVLGLVVGIPLSQVVYNRRQRFGANDKQRAGRYLLAWIAGPALVTALMLVPWLVDWQKCPPSDASLIENWQSNQSSFERMASEEQANDSNPSAQYTQLVKANGCREYASNILPQAALFYAWNYGDKMMFAPVSDKGYVYAAKPPQPLTDNLDCCAHSGDADVQEYRHISGNWYLFYWYQPS